MNTRYKIDIFVLTALLACPLSAVGAEEVSLEWRLPPDGQLVYQTDMTPEDGENIKIEFNIDSTLETEAMTDEVKDKLHQLEFPDDWNMVTILDEIENGHIKSTSYYQNWQSPFKDLNANDDGEGLAQFTELMNTVPQLEGELDSRGSLQSFFLPQRQKNMFALMHQLPEHPVKVGDTWNINFYCIELGGGFSADAADRVNLVQLADVVTDDAGDHIAIIEYMLTEKVSGTMVNPMAGGQAAAKRAPSEMSCSYIGKHEFYIDKGYWKRVTGEMMIHSKGIINSDMKQRIGMRLIDAIPGSISHEKSVGGQGDRK